jgi:hypothetical protein
MVESHGIPTIIREDCAAYLHCGLKDFRVGRTRHSGLTRRDYVVVEDSKLIDHAQREVLIGRKRCHGSSRLVLVDQPIDLLAMGTVTGPGVHQILRPQRWIIRE